MTKGKLFIKAFVLLFVSLFVTKHSYAQSLQWALEETIRANPEVQIPAKDRLANDQALRQAKAGYLPKVDVTAGHGPERARNSNTVFNGSQQTLTMPHKDATLTIDQTLFDGSATYHEVARNKAKVLSSAYKVSGTAQDVGLRAVEVYITVLLRQELLELSRRNLSHHLSTLDMINKRTDSGIGKRADSVQAEGRVALARSNLTADEANLKDTETNYLRVIGRVPHELVMPLEPAKDHFPRSEREAVDWAILNHPTLKSTKSDVDATHEQFKAASPMYPHFNAVVNVTRSNDVEGVRGIDNDDSALLRMNYNLYSDGKDLARIRETAYLKQEASEVMHKTLRQVVENIQLSWNALMVARRQLSLLKSHMDDSQETVSAYQKQFQLGQRTLLDLLDAENEFYTASRNYAEGRYNELFAQFRVLNGIGCLLERVGVRLPSESTPQINT